MQRLVLINLVFCLSMLACGEPPDADDPDVAESERALGHASSPLSVDFTNCVESIGVGLVPTTQALALVPSQYLLVGTGQPVTPIVVRTSRCAGIAVDGHAAKPGAIVQIGAVIVPPDGTGDINNYVFWYFTTDGRLAARLKAAGVEAQHLPAIDYDYQAAASGSPAPFHVAVPRPGDPRLSLAGTVVAPATPAGAFRANWWSRACGRSVKMDTNVPVIAIGSASLTLTTSPGSPLGRLLGAGSAGFPVLEQFNRFASAHLAVSATGP